MVSEKEQFHFLRAIFLCQSDKHRHTHINKQTNKQTNKHTNTHTHTHTHTHTPKKKKQKISETICHSEIIFQLMTHTSAIKIQANGSEQQQPSSRHPR